MGHGRREFFFRMAVVLKYGPSRDGRAWGGPDTEVARADDLPPGQRGAAGETLTGHGP
jgi:hypothetical protein